MAQTVPHLPTEILHKILGISKFKELLQARLVSSQWCAISAVYLFKRQRFDVLVYKKEEKGFRCRKVLMTKHLVKCVQDLLVYIYPREEKVQEYELTGTVQDTFRDLYKLDHLSTLTIRFPSNPVIRNMDAFENAVIFRRRILTTVLTPLMCLPIIKPTIHYLCIDNLQSSNDSKLTNSLWFIDLLRNLRTLVLIIWQTEPWKSRLDNVLFPQTISFFQSLPDNWLRPACQNLRTLYLSGGHNWGWHPKADFRHIHFPKLQSLTLYSFVFSHDWQLEWVLSLNGSLRNLKLLNCLILSFADTTPQFLDSDGYLAFVPGPQHRDFEGEWSHFFTAFARALPVLQLFSLWAPPVRSWPPGAPVGTEVGTEDVPVRIDKELKALRHDSRYTYFKRGAYIISENDHNENPASVETPQQCRKRKQFRETQDKQALLRLLNTIKERKAASL